MWKLFLQIAAAVLGIWLSAEFIPGVELVAWDIKTLLLVGFVLGLINFFIKPILKVITFPIRLLTLGLFSLVIDVLLVFLVDVIFPELIIEGIVPLLWTSLIVWLFSWFLPKWLPDKKT